MSENVSIFDFPDIRWKGHWIWVSEDKIEMGQSIPGDIQPLGQESTGLFRKTFNISSVPQHAPARITADSRYILYINGKKISYGPARSQPRRMMYDMIDLSPMLIPGENLIAVQVKYYGRANSIYMPALANIGLGRTGMLVFEANLGEEGWLISDTSWKAMKCQAWEVDVRTGQGLEMVGRSVPVEMLDARKLPVGWQNPSFNDSNWSGPQLLRSLHVSGFAHSQPPTDPYGPLYPRPIALLSGSTVTPVSIKTELLQGPVEDSIPMPAARVIASMNLPTVAAEGIVLPLQVGLGPGGARLEFDFSHIVAGQVQLAVDAQAGTTFDLCYTEEPLSGREQGWMAPSNGSRYIARGSEDNFEVFDTNGMRFITILIHNTSSPVMLKYLAVQERIYPWTPGATFECSDSDLNKLYMAGIRTVSLNSQDAFTDCPTREQRAWVGDSVIHQMVHLATNQDWRLAWQYLNLCNSPRSDGLLPMSVAGEVEGNNMGTIPDWGLHWVHGIHNLYRFSGDRVSVKSYMPTIERLLRWYASYQTREGVLKDVIESNLVDWSSLCLEDTSSILTAIWARGLKEFAEMAAWLEEKASQHWAEELYSRAKTGYEMFWDETRGTYVDHIKDAVQQKPISQVAGALAVASELAPKERWVRIMQTVTDDQRLVVRSWSASGGEFSMEKMQKQMMGIYEIDWDTEHEIVISQPFFQYVVHDAVVKAGLADKLPELYRRWIKFLHDGYDTFGECWNWGTHVHGWSSTVTRDIVFYTLGVTPAEPGYTQARIAPRLGTLEWVKGKVPTPYGLIDVDVTTDKVIINSPIPFILDLEGEVEQRFKSGKEEITRK